MSQSEIMRFPARPERGDNNPGAADDARRRIADIPDPYVAHAAPSKERLVGAFDPVSPAAEEEVPNGIPKLRIRSGEQPASDMLPPASQVAATVSQPGTPLANPLEEPSGSRQQPTEPPAAPGKTRRRGLPGQLKPLITGAVTFVLLFLLFKAPIFLSQIGYLTHSKPATVAHDQAAAQIPPDPVISIPKINVNAPVVYANSNVEANIQHDLESGVVHYANSALPGENGNSVIFGHSSNDWWEPGNYKFVFVLLDKLQPGDTFTVNYNAHQYLYRVTGSRVVEPTDLSVLAPTSGPVMTLITCTPPGTSWKRLVVTANQISPVTQNKPSSQSTTPAGGGALPGNSPGLTETLSNWWRSLVNVLGLSHDSTGSNPGSGATTLPGGK